MKTRITNLLIFFAILCSNVINHNIYAQDRNHNIDSLIYAGANEFANHESESSLRLFELALTILESNQMYTDSNYFTLLAFKTVCLVRLSKLNEAIKFGESAAHHLEKNINQIQAWQLHQIYKSLEVAYGIVGDYPNQKRMGLKALGLLEREDAQCSENYIHTLSDISFINSFLHDKNGNDSINEKSYECLTEGFEINIRNVAPVSIIAESMYTSDDFWGRDIDLKIISWAESYLEELDVDNVIYFLDDAAQIFNLVYPINSYVRCGRNEECVGYVRKMVSKIKNITDKEYYDTLTISLYIPIAQMYSACFNIFYENGYWGDAFDVLQKEYNATYTIISVLQNSPEFKLEKFRLFYNFWENYATYNRALERYPLALHCDTTKITGLLLMSEEGDPVSLGDAYDDISTDLWHIGDTVESIKYMSGAAYCYRKSLGDDSPRYALALIYFAEGILAYGDTTTAFMYIDTVKNIISKKKESSFVGFCATLYHMANFYIKMGQYSEAYNLLSILLNPEYDNEVDRSEVYQSILLCLLKLDNPLETISVTERLYNEQKEAIKYGFLSRSKTAQARFWNKKRHIFTTVIPLSSYIEPNPTTIGDAFNSSLLAKSIILNTDVNMHDIIFHSGDEELMKLYDTINFYLSRIEKETDKEVAFTIELLKVEQRMSEKIKEYGDATRDMTIEWADVQKSLIKDEIAVEFNSFTTGKDSTIIVAYVIRPNWSAPQQIVIAELAKGESLTKGNVYSNAYLSKTIWGKMSSVLDGAKTIYFSPAGELYNIAIESLPDYEDSTRLISDRYNLYRLSSTRELAKDKKKIPIKNGSIYGGLRYDAKIDTTLRGTDGNRSFTYFPWTADSTSIGTRGNLPTYLPNTLTEAQYIGDLMSRTSIKSHVYTGGKGDEASFKRLSGSNANLLHIATHGFYYEGTQEVKQKRESVVGEDKSMTRSGLLFAGVNTTLNSQHSNANTYNDGILTAQEIAQLDLKNVDMAVLSACETGLGELKGDGVFGLQRGFKKAGVNSIIMSLWKVDDRATQMLMTQFYENWLIKKMPKQKALKEAQEYVRNFEIDELEWAVELRKQKKQRGGGGNFRTHAIGKSKTNKTSSGRTIKPFQDPKYWAAFILLDGLD